MRLLLLACWLLVAATASAEEEGWRRLEALGSPIWVSASVGFDFSRGDYGESEDTDFYAIPAALKLEWRSWSFRVAMPLLVRDGLDVLPEEGSGTQDDLEQTSTDVDVGDLTTSLTWSWYPQREYVPIVDLTAKVKIPTAPKSEGLGTGDPDFTLQVDLLESIGPASLFAGFGHRFKGGSNFRDIWLASAGFGWRFSPTWSAGAFYDWRQGSAEVKEFSRIPGIPGVIQTTDRADDAHELVPYVTLRVSDALRLSPYGVAGFTDASPDWGLGFTATYDF